MSPRPLARSGLRGPGQDVFPEMAKESTRRIALKDEAALIHVYSETDDGGGDVKPKWTPSVERVRGRIDAIGTRGIGAIFAEQIDESITHVITLDPDVEVSTRDRIEIEGVMWTIVAQQVFSDQASTRVAVKEL